jgi:predicted transcriptional regulator
MFSVLRYPHVMSTNVQIEVDEQTADVLQTRAAELGVTVSELVAELATLESEPIVIEADDIAELDRRWMKIEAGGRTVPHERVVRWLRTWGTPRFRPWPGH